MKGGTKRRGRRDERKGRWCTRENVCVRGVEGSAADVERRVKVDNDREKINTLAPLSREAVFIYVYTQV